MQVSNNLVNNNTTTNNVTNEAPPNLNTTPDLPPDVLQILTDVGCTLPEAFTNLEKDLALLEKDITHIKNKPLNTRMLPLAVTGIAGIVLLISTIALLIFGQIPLAALSAVFAFVAIRKFSSSLAKFNSSLADRKKINESIQEHIEATYANLDSIDQWAQKVSAREEENDLSPEQVTALMKASLFSISRTNKALSVFTKVTQASLFLI